MNVDASLVKQLRDKTGAGLMACKKALQQKKGDLEAVLVEINCETDFVARNADFRKFVKDIAMQVCSAHPAYVSRDEVPPEVIERERAIYKTQAASTGKPEKILDKIADGKMEKFYQQACLLDQPFNQDDSITIQDYLNDVKGRLGENIRIRRFVRFQLGEDSES
jgi:elongation factor Ts